MKAETFEATVLDAVNVAVGPCPSERDELVQAKVRGLLRGYDARWSQEPYEPIVVEQTLTGELFNPDSKTQSKSRTFTIAGKIDLLAMFRDKRTLLDHKTTSDDLSVDSTYWQQLAIESQPTHYMLLLWLNGQKTDDVIWDVIRKPGIKPKKLTKADQAAVVQPGGTYCGEPISEESRGCLVLDPRETLELYEIRLAKECIEQSERYFARRYVPRSDAEIMQYAKHLWQHAKDILYARQTAKGDAMNLPPTSGSCMAYRSPCKYLGICAGHDTPESDKWMRKANVHSELPELEGDGRDVLTNSRIKCFLTCRRKHFFAYEMGLERQDSDESLALYFGHIMHAGLEAWWHV